MEDTFEDEAFEETKVAITPLEAEKLVEDTFEEEAVVATRVGVLRYPDTERFVPEAVVKRRSDVETFAMPIEVPEAEEKVVCPTTWNVPARVSFVPDAEL